MGTASDKKRVGIVFCPPNYDRDDPIFCINILYRVLIIPSLSVSLSVLCVG